MIELTWAILGLAFAALLAIFAFAELKARRLGIDRARIEARYAGYDGADLDALFAGWGADKVAAYRDDLLLRDRVFAAGLMMWAPFFGLLLALESDMFWLGPLAAGLIITGCLFDLKEGTALRHLMTTWPAKLPSADVALALRSTRLKRLFYTAGLATGAFALLSLGLDAGYAALIVALLGALRFAIWFFV